MADLGGGCIPPTNLKVTILAEKSASISNNSAPFRDASPPHQPKRNESGRKITLNYGEDLFFFFFGDHLILGEKIVGISDFGRKITLNFGEDIRIFEVLCLKSPPHQNFLDPPLVRMSKDSVNFQTKPLIFIIKIPKIELKFKTFFSVARAYQTVQFNKITNSSV